MKKRIVAILAATICIFGAVCAFAQGSGYNLKYSIDINLTQNQVMIYEKDENGNYTKPYKTFVCSVGETTPEGEFYTTDKYIWRFLFGDVYGQYATRITGHILFHSVPYYKQDKSTLEYEEYNKLGTTASMGCIRLTVEDAKWIYDNCPSGTRVRMFRSDEKMPLEKPVAQKLDLSDTVMRNWDPTDPDARNPWIGYEDRKELEKLGLTTQNLEISAGDKVYTKDVLIKNDAYYLPLNDINQIFKALGLKADNEIIAGAAISIDKSVEVKESEIQKIRYDNYTLNENKVIVVLNSKKLKTTALAYKNEPILNLNTICFMADINFKIKDGKMNFIK